MMLEMLLLAGATPTSAAPRDVVTAMFAAFNRHDAAAMAKLYAPEANLTSPDFCAPRGRRDVERTYAALFTAYPDIRDDVQQMVVEGEVAAVRFVAVSRTGDLTLPIQAMIRVRNGLIVDDAAIFDTGGKPCE